VTSDNPLLTPSRTPPFDRVEAAHAVPAVEWILAEAEAAVARLEAGAAPSWGGLMDPLYRLQEPLGYAWGLVHHHLGVLNSEAWREAERALQPKVVAFSMRVGQSEPLYRAMQALDLSPEGRALPGPRRRILDSSLRAARLSGVGLPPEQRQAFNAAQTELAELATRFQNNVLDATKAFSMVLTSRDEIDGLPDSLLAAAAQSAATAGQAGATPEAGPWRITLEAALFVPFMRFSRRRDLRERLYRAYVTRASDGAIDNQPLVERILALRREKARLLGFSTFADLSLSTKMAPGVAAVDELTGRLRAASMPSARRDLEDLQALADRAAGRQAPLQPWDVAFWAERLREERFQFNSEDLRPYFQFPHVLEGMFALTEELFGVRIVPADGEASVWHPDVRLFRVLDPDGRLLARFYLDPYSRPETKRGGAWMDPFAPRDGCAAGDPLLPVVFLVCNQAAPAGGRPSLMSFDEVETLFHEFGHGLQHMLTTVDDPEAAGIANIEWDAVELASQFMENWCYHRATLRRLSAHVDTGEPISDELFDRLSSARVFRAGSDMLRQLFFGQVDMELHHRYAGPSAGDSAEAVKERVAKSTTVMPLLPEDRMLCGFTHIFASGYAAGYYSYKWSEVLSADAFGAFEDAGVDDAAALVRVGRRYRETFLALGGGTHPMDVFRAFRGRDPDPAALLRQSGLV
jgi:oligopeptidase A